MVVSKRRKADERNGSSGKARSPARRNLISAVEIVNAPARGGRRHISVDEESEDELNGGLTIAETPRSPQNRTPRKLGLEPSNIKQTMFSSSPVRKEVPKVVVGPRKQRQPPKTFQVTKFFHGGRSMVSLKQSSTLVFEEDTRELVLRPKEDPKKITFSFSVDKIHKIMSGQDEALLAQIYMAASSVGEDAKIDIEFGTRDVSNGFCDFLRAKGRSVLFSTCSE